MGAFDLYPVFTTPELDACRDFWGRHFGFGPIFQASWFVLLQASGGQMLAFMHPDHPSSPPGPEPFQGPGMFLTVRVDDSAAAFALLQAQGAPIDHPLTVEPWGQRRFMTRDPAGIAIDVVEQVEPAPGYWDPFMVPETTRACFR